MTQKRETRMMDWLPSPSSRGDGVATPRPELRSADETATPPAAPSNARLRQMVGEHFDLIWRSLRRLGVREGDVDDLIQRVFLTASRRLAEIRPGAERSFLFAVALREASHVRRSYRRRAEVSEEAIADKSTGKLRPDEIVGRSEALSAVTSILDSMDEDLRLVFTLFEVEEIPIKEIAQMLDLRLGTAKSRLRRAREQFAARAEKLGVMRPSWS